MKLCPFCSQQIQPTDTVCPGCGSHLRTKPTSPENSANTMDAAVTARHKFDTLDVAATQQAQNEQILGSQYRIVRKIGEGGMGQVYLAEDIELENRQVAIKVLPPVLANNPRAVANLRREALTAISLTHPNIIRLHGFHSDGDVKFLVMEYVKGRTLEEILAERAGGKIGLHETMEMTHQIGSALEYAHSCQPPVIHRDLKPSNIMIDDTGKVRVLDFGIARQMKDSFTRVTGKQETSGTLPYMSPEQLRGKKASPAMDIYSLAAVTYECLAGSPPYTTGDISWQIINEKPEKISGVPKEINHAILKALEKDPAHRFKTASEFVQAMGGKKITSAPTILPASSEPEKITETKPAPAPAERTPTDSAVQGRLCPQCNSLNPRQNRFCAECGYDFTHKTARTAKSAMGPKGKTRPIFAILLLQFITMGIYYIFWIHGLWKDARRYAHNRNGVKIMPAGLATILFGIMPMFFGATTYGIVYDLSVRNVTPSQDTILGVSIFLVVSFLLWLIGIFKTPGLVRKMRLAKGTPKSNAGHTAWIGIIAFLFPVGPLAWMITTQAVTNSFWNKEA